MKDSMRFRDYDDFFRVIAEMGKASDDGSVYRWDTPFAAIRSEAYHLSAGVVLKIFEINPEVDIHIPYEFDDGHFEAAYCVSGRLLLDDEYCGRAVFHTNSLSLEQKFCSRGNMVFHGRHGFRGIAFSAGGDAVNLLLGDEGGELWTEATGAGDPDRTKNMYIGAPAPRDVAGSFLQVMSCGYPDRTKKLFFESKFREILTRIIAHHLYDDKLYGDASQFDADQVRKIPWILMERIDDPPSIQELARELSMNTTAMKKGFKEMFGEPIYAHHRNLCLERAAAALLGTPKTVFEVALENGYSSGVSFCNAFKRRYGVSPGAYRKRLTAS
jgi:AraC-like DNA-binding protein